jgi:hypothetical protein
VIARCSCGAVFWVESPSSCPRCGAPAIVRAKLETLEEFEARILADAQTSAQIRSLREIPG